MIRIFRLVRKARAALIRVGFNAYLLAAPNVRGWLRYTVNLLAALPAHGVRPVLYSIAPVHANHLARLPANSFELRPAGPMRYLRWEQVWLPRQCRADRVDVLHAPMNYGLPWWSPCPRVLTLHDAIGPIYDRPRVSGNDWLRPAAWRSRFAHWSSRIRADGVLTVSEHAKGDLIRVLKVPPSKLRVTPEAADELFHRPVDADRLAESRRKWELPRPYFFYVGGWEARKNLPFLLKAFAAARLTDIELVLAGGQDEHRPALQALAAKLGIADRVRFLGYVPEDDLPALYAGALSFVYASEYEGFGLQLTEAMALGVPLLAADATCLPEVLGTGGETFSLADPASLASLLGRVATDAAYRSSLAARSTLRSNIFSWDRTASLTASVYRELLDRGARS